MEELIKRLERVIQTGAPDKDGMHPISAETVLEVVKELSELSTNLAEVSTDCISRQQAIDALVAETIYTEEELKEYYEANSHRNEWVNGIYDAVETVKQLPPIQPKRGRWIKLDMHRGMADHKCTACKQECYVPTCMGEPMYAYCPNCGAKMEVNHESN